MTARSLTLMAILAAAAITAEGCDSPTATASSAVDGRQRNDPEGGCGNLPTAPPSQRVDLVKPTFSDPTNIANPLFPISNLDRVLLLGSVDGEPLRVETTLLSDTRTIRTPDVNGHQVTTLVSQYVAWLDRRIHEVALDFYAQADGGAAWYLGEDVFNYEDGRIADTDGTWLAGRDGPVAMIMAANPQVGNVWRPENICGLVFEEVTVKSTGVTVEGPRGPVAGAIVVEELHMDGTLEDKIFAPGYGEFSTGDPGGDLEAVALAVPTDALPGPTPAELGTLSSGAAEIFDAAQSEAWDAASAAVGTMTGAWDTFRAAGVPPMLEVQMSGALAAVVEAVAAREPAEARQAAIDVALASLDFQLRHRPRAEIDLALLDLWARQLLVDAAADDEGAVLGDVATLRWIRDRIAHDVASPDLSHIDAQLSGLRAAAAARDPAAATAASARLRSSLARAQVTGRRS